MKWILVLMGFAFLGGILAVLAGLIWKHKEEVWIGFIVMALVSFSFLVGRLAKVW